MKLKRKSANFAESIYFVSVHLDSSSFEISSGVGVSMKMNNREWMSQSDAHAFDLKLQDSVDKSG